LVKDEFEATGSFKFDVDEDLSKKSVPSELFLSGARQIRKIASHENMNDNTFGTQNQSMLPNASSGDNSLSIIKVFPVLETQTPTSDVDPRCSDSPKLDDDSRSVSDKENIIGARLTAPKESIKSRFSGVSYRSVSSRFQKNKSHMTSGSENDAEGYDGLEEKGDENHIVRSPRKQQTMNPLHTGKGIGKEGRRNNSHSVKGKPPNRSLSQVIAKYGSGDYQHDIADRISNSIKS
jgi:hypothetical protein